MASRKELRREKKRQARMSRADKSRSRPHQPKGSEGAPAGKSAEALADKVGKEVESRQQEREKARDGLKLEKVKSEAARAQSALAAGQAALAERKPLLSRELGDDGEGAPGKGEAGGLWAGISKTRNALASGLGRILLGKKRIDRELLGDLEELLITADIGFETTQRLMEAVKRNVRRSETDDPETIKEVLRTEIHRVLNRPQPAAALKASPAAGKPVVMLFVGVNGSGKTTTIGKFAAKARERGDKVLLAAGDTFRAAAAEQLGAWGERTGCDLFTSLPGADPSGVIHKAIQQGINEGYDLILCDTAGRLHTKTNLMEELKKIKRVITALIPEAPHETYLVLDANTGQNAIRQTQDFHKAVGVTGLIVTKLDGTARGGVLIGIVNEFNIPVRYIGLGEKSGDFRSFDAKEFADAVIA